MGKERAKRLAFRNGKELLDGCIHKLNEDQRGGVGGNVALHPVVIIIMGKKSREFTKYIKTTLDDNWNNARFLRYLNVIKQDDGYVCAALKESENYGECRWDEADETFEDSLDKAIVSMLETDEKIFQDRMSVKMEYILDATQEDGKEYFDLFRNMHGKMQLNELKTMYLMIDQSPEGGRAERSDQLVKYVVETHGERAGTIYLLSNHLKSGRMLGKSNIFENYRLIADIILLGGNRAGAAVLKENLYNGIKTVSYALVTKPTDEIAAVALRTLVSLVYEEEKARRTHEITEQEIREKLRLDQYNGTELAERIFQEKVENAFPSPECFRYLPFRCVKDGKDALKNNAITVTAMDAVTYHAASAFIKMHYEEPVEKLFRNEASTLECRRQIREELQGKFDFFDLLELNGKRDSLKSMLEPEYLSHGNGSPKDFGRSLHYRAAFRGKKLFYEKIKRLYLEELENLIDLAVSLEKTYRECGDEIQREWVVTGDESKSVEKVYTSLVGEFVRSNRKVNEHKSAFPEVFNPNNTKEDLLWALWQTFCSLIKMKEFSYDFECEVGYRMDSMNEAQRYLFVSEELQKRLDGSIRINSTFGEMIKMSCYYLINGSADYANNLRQSDNNGKQYTLFDLNRTDCIEQLEIYNITRPELLQLVRGGMGNED